jgi:hypothetical protein
MEDKSNSWPLFRQSAEDLREKLSEIGTAEAMTLAREARELAETFRSWDNQRPANDVRIAAIQQLFSLNRRVMDFLTQRQKGKR